MWSIRIQMKTTDKTIFLTDGDIDFFAKILSQGTPFPVAIHAMARVRRIYQNGKMISDFPDLRVFYTNISDTQQWYWNTMGQGLKDED